MRTCLLTCLAASICVGADQPKVSYYLVESTMQSPQGQSLGASISLVKRVVDRAQARIDESIISLRGSAPALEIVTILKPDGRKVKISSTDGGFDGEGELTGEPWEWTGLKFTTRFAKGPLVEGEDHFTNDGLSAEKRIVGPDGRTQVLIKETGRMITEATYANLRARLLAK